MSASSLPRDEIDALTRRILAYQDGRLSEDDVRALEAELLACPERRRLYTQLAVDRSLISELLQDRDMVTPVPRREDPAPLRRGVLLGLVAALAATLVAAFLWRHTATVPVRPAPTLARVTYLRGARWEAGAARLNQHLRRGPYTLGAGRVRFRMADGTQVCAAAPVRFDILDDHTLALHAGSLGARVTDPNSVFAIRTDTVDVIDLGTAFGVNVDAAGRSTVAVFEGSVRLEQKTPPLREPLVRLHQGHAARSDRDGQIEPIAWDPGLFATLWPLTAGVDEVSDLIRFIPPVDLRPLGLYRSNERVQLLPERQNVLLAESLPIDFKLPRQLLAEGHPPRTTIYRGRRVSSYLLFFNSEAPKSWAHRHTVEGSVTFARPVLGIITTDRHLVATDTLLGLPGVTYPPTEGRGLKLGGRPLPGIPDDRIDLSPDRRTLTFRLHTGPNMDSLRVLVRAD